MKKIIFSILIATFAINAFATKPLDKLPAIVIDTIYVSSGALVIEYEALRPFNQISLSVQSSWEQATKNVQPVLLSGSTGKSKASVPINLITDQPIHFNVFLTGGQFVNKNDTADYHSTGYDYAIFKKQNDNSVIQYRTQYTEEEKTMRAARRGNMVLINREGQFIDGNGKLIAMNFSDIKKRSANEKFVDPLAVNINELMEMPDSINGQTRVTLNYNFSISGNVRTVTDANSGWGTFIPETPVFLFFINSSNPSQLYHPVPHGSTFYNGIHFVTTDHNGDFEFDFSATADLSHVNQAILFVGRFNGFALLDITGENAASFPVFNRNSNSTIAFNPNNTNFTETNKLITVDNIRMGGAIGMFYYAGDWLSN